MIPIFLYLQCLTFVNLNSRHHSTLETDHAHAIKTGIMLPFCNRVCAKEGVTASEILEVKNYFNEVIFTWFVQDSDKAQIQVLEESGLKYLCSFPAMNMHLSELKSTAYAPGIIIKEMIDESDMQIWLSIVTKSYGMTNLEAFAQFIDELKDRAGSTGIRFYCGFYGGIPAAVSLALIHDDVVALHWVGTLPEYRNKGLGMAVSSYPLEKAQKNGCNVAILFASLMGKPVYERIGFKEYANYKIFCA